MRLCEEGRSNSGYSPVSDQFFPATLVRVHRARRVQRSEAPNCKQKIREKHSIEILNEEFFIASTRRPQHKKKGKID
jgi:hypothetical protein